MLSKAGWCFAICAPVTLVLQGCGGGGGGTTPRPGPGPPPSPSPPTPSPTPSSSTSSTPTTTTTTTTTTLVPRTPGWSAEEAVQELNAMYMDFNETDDSTKLGVTVSFAGSPSSFLDNVFCSGYVNTTCKNGNNDCRMSAALINHRIMVQPDGDGWRVVPLMQRSVGYIFNQSLSEDYFGKCSFLYDGADSYNVNLGCGNTATNPHECSNPNSAYYNMCTADGGDTYHHCTATDTEVVSKKCKCETCSPVYGTVDPPRFKSDEACYYEMPALIVDHDNPSDFTPSKTNHLRESIRQRVTSDDGTGQRQEWNEVVIDERLLLPQIQRDPTHTIVAFVYVDGAGDQSALQEATSMRDKFQETYSVSGVPDIPVIKLDARNDFTQSGGPFMLTSPQSRVDV